MVGPSPDEEIAAALASHREAMLDRTNAEVARRLDLDGKPRHVVDLGCGLGATARFLTRLGAASSDRSYGSYPKSGRR